MEKEVKELIDQRNKEFIKTLKWALGVYIAASITILSSGIGIVYGVLKSYSSEVREASQATSKVEEQHRVFKEDFGFALQSLDARFDGVVFGRLAEKYKPLVRSAE